MPFITRKKPIPHQCSSKFDQEDGGELEREGVAGISETLGGARAVVKGLAAANTPDTDAIVREGLEFELTT